MGVPRLDDDPRSDRDGAHRHRALRRARRARPGGADASGQGARLMESGERPIVAVARVLPDAGLERLRERYEVRSGGLDANRAEVLRLVAGAAAIVADPTVPIDAEVLDAAGPQLRVVANFAVGYDNVDLDACRERGIPVTNTPDVLTDATAEPALALTLAAARDLGMAERQLRAGRWRHGWDPEGHVGIELSGAVFGIVGMGRIGRRYAELVRPLAGA